MLSADILVRAERWLLPAACLLCQGPVAEAADEPLICLLCQSRFRRLPEPQCRRCGQPNYGDPDPCRLCPAWPDGFIRVRSAVWLDQLARSAVHQLKYGGWWRVSESMARVCENLLPTTSATLVPIPLARGRRRRRGYNQAERLAHALGVRRCLPVQRELLLRARNTSTQTALAPEARQANVAGAFRVLLPPPRHVVLVDDVFTTGATMVEAARTLLAAGAGVVEAVTFARALPPV